MFAVYAEKPDFESPISGLRVGERPEPKIPAGWVRVKVSHASLNRHDIFTLRGITAHESIPFPMILGNDGVGTLDDGSEVIIYPVMGGADWRGDETLDPEWHIFSEKVPGTFADYVAVPRRNAIPKPPEISALEASVLGTAWLTANRALFTKARLQPGQTLLVQGATGGMSTALIQLARAAGVETWVTSRSREGRSLAERLGARRTFGMNEALPSRVDAVIDNIGQATWGHSLQSVRAGGTVVTVGITTGNDPSANLLRLIAEKITIIGSIMGTREEMNDLIYFMVKSKIRPEIGKVVPMEQAGEAIREMIDGRTHGKTVFTRCRSRPPRRRGDAGLTFVERRHRSRQELHARFAQSTAAWRFPPPDLHVFAGIQANVQANVHGNSASKGLPRGLATFRPGLGHPVTGSPAWPGEIP